MSHVLLYSRLQDVLNGLRIKCAKQEKQYKDENTQLSENYKQITEQFRDLQKKSRYLHYPLTNPSKKKEKSKK